MYKLADAAPARGHQTAIYSMTQPLETKPPPIDAGDPSGRQASTKTHTNQVLTFVRHGQPEGNQRHIARA